MLEIFSRPIGLYATNCYIIKDRETGAAAAVDCAVFNGDYKRLLFEADVKSLDYILLTHGHFDHICGVEELCNFLGGRVCIHKDDAECLTDEYKSQNASMGYAVQGRKSADVILNDGDTITLGNTKLHVLHTPGHTKGSVCFLTENEIFSGDTLFRGSCGRTDLPGGDTNEILSSLKRLSSLPGDLTVYPGHGSMTSIGEEKRNNPYF